MRRVLMTVSVVAWILAAVFAAAGSDALAAGGLTKIEDGVYSYADVKNGAPSNSFGANAGIIIGKEGIVVVDTLISSKEAQRFIKDIRAVSPRPFRYVVNTHSHLDHTFGNLDFRRLGAVIVSQEKCKENMEKNSETALKNAAQYGLTENDMKGTEVLYPSLTFGDRMTIDLGDRKVELIYPGPSHTSGSILVYVPDKKVLFAGDVLFTGYHPFIGDGDIEGWIKALDYILTLDVEKIVPGHGPVSTKKDIQDMKDYLIAFDRKAKELCAQSNDLDYIV
ncbi:MAG TPA: MBL fold metallo-hydrolase, partial [Dissulfurispiraceae bacterium]